jgi:hypothetical protein
VPNWSACILGGIQEEKLARLAPKISDDGLLQRFLMARVANKGRPIDREPNYSARDTYSYTIHAIAKITPDREPIILSAGAQKYRREVEDIALAIRDMPTYPPGLRDHANKINGLFARLLLTLHTIECSPIFRTDLFATVSEETAKRARDLMVRFFIPNAVQIYTDYFGGCDEHGSDVQWIAGHILAHSYECCTYRDLNRAGQRKFTADDPRLYRAILTLVECGWLEPVTPKRPNDPPKTWKGKSNNSFDLAEHERQQREAMRKMIAHNEGILRGGWN